MRIVIATVTALLVLAGCSSSPGAPELTAEQVVNQLSQRIPTAAPGVVYTAETDPNNMLGRPEGYTSKAAFTDNRINPAKVVDDRAGSVELGGSVEMFCDEGDAEKRGRGLIMKHRRIDGAWLLD